ncbi:hypothetical protein ACFVVX_14705 [Kitasatospora sp. NPDC058170]|uniref:hypothetical protein n=1 Tax=Kitasatospora sp. NPDC058170 TaxID=3346364 RepID=UPI0036D89E49
MAVWAALGVLFALIPLAFFLARARTLPWRVSVGAALGLWAALMFAVGFELLQLRSEAELWVLYLPVAVLLAGFGLLMERQLEGPREERPRGWARAAGVAFWIQLALAVPAVPLAALVAFHEAQVPSAQALPDLPRGYSTLRAGQDCGSGHDAVCWRTLHLAGPPGVPVEEAADRLRPRHACEPNGWLLDRRRLCTDVSTDAGTIVYRVRLGSGL